MSELYEEKKAEEWKEYSESKEFYDEFRERLDRDKEIDSDKESDLFNQFSQDSYEDWSCNYDEEYRADYFDESFEELNNGQWPDCLRDEAEQYPVEVEIDWEGVGDDWAKENANV